jgi:hypothetical protein
LDLGTVFGDWGVAQYLGSGGKYGYGSFTRELFASPALAAPQVATYPFDSARATVHPSGLQPWGQQFYRFAGRGDTDLILQVGATGAHLRVAAILQDSTGVVPTRVSWLDSRVNRDTNYRVGDFGGLYDRVSLAVSYIGTSGGSDPTAVLRLRARLVDVSHNDRPAGLAAPAGGDFDLAVRQITKLHELFAFR